MRRGALVMVLVIGPLLRAGVARARPTPGKSAPASSPAPPSESPEERLARGRQAYLRNDFAATVQAVRPLLYPEVLLPSDEDVIEAHRLLALASLFTHPPDERAAGEEFEAILQLRPAFTLDAVVDPPTAIRFLEALKGREEDRLRRIERQAAEQALRAEQARRAAEEDRVRKVPVVIRTVERHHFVLALLPFGVGQFQNGEHGKAIALLTTELALGVTSLGLWSALQVKYHGGKIPVPATDVPAANAINVSAIVIGGVFWADVVYGLVDAILHYRAEVVHEVTVPAGSLVLPPHASLKAAPLVAPGGSVGAGLVLQGVF